MAKEHDDWLKGIGVSLDKLRGQNASAAAGTDAAVDGFLKHGDAVQQQAIADAPIPDAAKAALSAYADFSTGVTEGAYQGLKAVAGAAQSAADAVSGVALARGAVDVVTAPVSTTARQDLGDDLAKASAYANLTVDPVGTLASAAVTGYQQDAAQGEGAAEIIGKGVGFAGVVATAGAVAGGAGGDAAVAADAGTATGGGVDTAAGSAQISPMATTGAMPAVSAGADVAAGASADAAAGGEISPMAKSVPMPAVGDAAAGSSTDPAVSPMADSVPAPTLRDPQLEEGVSPTHPAPPVTPGPGEEAPDTQDAPTLRDPPIPNPKQPFPDPDIQLKPYEPRPLRKIDVEPPAEPEEAAPETVKTSEAPPPDAAPAPQDPAPAETEEAPPETISEGV